MLSGAASSGRPLRCGVDPGPPGTADGVVLNNHRRSRLAPRSEARIWFSWRKHIVRGLNDSVSIRVRCVCAYVNVKIWVCQCVCVCHCGQVWIRVYVCLCLCVLCVCVRIICVCLLASLSACEYVYTCELWASACDCVLLYKYIRSVGDYVYNI